MIWPDTCYTLLQYRLEVCICDYQRSFIGKYISLEPKLLTLMDSVSFIFLDLCCLKFASAPDVWGKFIHLHSLQFFWERCGSRIKPGGCVPMNYKQYTLKNERRTNPKSGGLEDDYPFQLLFLKVVKHFGGVTSLFELLDTYFSLLPEI